MCRYDWYDGESEDGTISERFERVEGQGVVYVGVVFVPNPRTPGTLKSKPSD